MKYTMNWLAVILLAAISCPSFAGEREDIIARCHQQMSEYGWAMVKAYADQDIEAETALRGY